MSEFILDAEAKANLDKHGYKEYEKYREELFRDEKDVGYIEDVLRGWIWEIMEGEEGVVW